MSKKKALYTGLFLDQASRSKLISMIGEEFSALNIIHAHHLTLKFGPNPTEVHSLPLGSIISLRATGYRADEKALAVSCEVPGGLICTNKHPHITVAVAEGVKPVYSNTLLAQGNLQFVAPIDLSARVGFFDGSVARFDFTDTIYEE